MNRIELNEASLKAGKGVMEPLTFVNVLHAEAEELLVDFSDGTSARFSAGQLAALRPVRERWNCEDE